MLLGLTQEQCLVVGVVVVAVLYYYRVELQAQWNSNLTMMKAQNFVMENSVAVGVAVVVVAYLVYNYYKN